MITESRRDARGKELNNNGHVKKVNDHSFKVKSQSGNGFYEIKETKDGMTCTCPDFVYRGGNCKHIAATRYYLEVQKDTPQGIVYEKIHLTYAQAWDAYNAAQKSEIKLFDELLKDLVQAIPEPEQQTMGRPRLSIHENLFCAIQKVYSQLSKPPRLRTIPERDRERPNQPSPELQCTFESLQESRDDTDFA